MKRNFIAVALLTLIFLPGINRVAACTVNVESFRKNFRQAKRVFLGEITAIDLVKIEELPKEIQEQHKDLKFLAKIIFKVERSWKGDNRNEVIVYSKMFCDCPYRTEYFSLGKKFLVFSDKQSYFDACSLFNAEVDSKEIPTDSWEAEFVKNKINRLDDFWFRTWARIYPF